MTLAFDRAWKVTAYWPPEPSSGSRPDYAERLTNGVEIDGLDIQFTITKTLAKEPNPCELTIVNAAESTRSRLQKRPLTVRIEAGYQKVTRLLFIGNLRYGEQMKEGVDFISKLKLSDGGRAFSNARCNEVFSAGTPYSTIVRFVAGTLGLILPRELEENVALGARLPAGLTLDDRAEAELTRILAQFGYSWSIQNGKLQALADGQVRDDRAWVIDGEAGLVGSPMYSPPDDKGGPPTLVLKCLLFPELVPGGRIDVRSKNVNGEHRITEVRHTGDTAGTDWYTEVKATK